MQSYLLFAGTNATGRKTNIDLEDDLIELVKNHGGELSTSFELTGSSNLGFTRRIIRLYEIPLQGAINLQVSNQRNIEIGEYEVDGLVTCLGFDESAECFQELHSHLYTLCCVYNRARTQ